MANTKSAIKAARQNLRRNIRNRTVKTRLKTLSKNLAAAHAAGKKDEERQLAVSYLSALDKAAKANVVHRNVVSRHKSRWGKVAMGQQPA
jgi:small subunit ribosomal protein S20